MKYLRATFLTGLMATTLAAHAGVQIGGTRVIYSGGKKEASLNISNPDKDPYLIQSWVEPTEGSTAKAPFLVTPPLFRLDAGQSNVLRIVQAGGLAEDRETMYWMDIKSIPSTVRSDDANTLQIAVKTRIKLIYRPASLKETPESQAQKLTWLRIGDRLQVTNPSPYYMNFQAIRVGNTPVKDATYVAPMSSASFTVPANISGAISWKIINDYGGIGPLHSNTR